MRPLTAVLQDGAWTGRRAFVVGSGPSLKGFDFSLLKNEFWIGCNEEYRHGPTIALVQDLRLFAQGGVGILPLRLRQDWIGGPHIPVYFKGHPDTPDSEGPDEIFLVNTAHSQKTPFRWGKSLEEGLYYGANVGMAALNLAEILGANPIYLLGFDAKDTTEKTHHHDHYPKNWTLHEAESRQVVYNRWIKAFREIKEKLKPETKVYNLNPDSAIDAFKKGRVRVSPSMWDIEVEA